MRVLNATISICPKWPHCQCQTTQKADLNYHIQPVHLKMKTQSLQPVKIEPTKQVSDNSKSRLELSHSDSSFENEDAKFAACEDRTNQTNYEFGRANVKQIKIIFFSF